MAVINVFAAQGMIRSTTCYCYDCANCVDCPHPPVQSGVQGSQWDIQMPAGAQVYAKVNGQCGSIRFQSLQNSICTGCQGTYMNNGVRAYLYTEKDLLGCMVGFVNFCHIDNIAVNFGSAPGNYYNIPSYQEIRCKKGFWSVKLGQIPAVDYGICPSNAGCYPVSHLHVSAKPEPVPGCGSVVLRNRGWGCYENVTGSDWMYKFTTESCCASVPNECCGTPIYPCPQ
jgi:hypothetical protein